MSTVHFRFDGVELRLENVPKIHVYTHTCTPSAHTHVCREDNPCVHTHLYTGMLRVCTPGAHTHVCREDNQTEEDDLDDIYFIILKKWY